MNTSNNKSNKGGVRPQFFIAAAAFLMVLIVVLFLLSGALDSKPKDAGNEVPEASATVSEEPTPTPTPTETPIFTIYVTSSAGGDAYATTNTVKQGGSDHITIIPDFGWQVAGVTVNGAPSAYTSSFDLTDVTADTVIHVEFRAPEQPSEVPAEEPDNEEAATEP